MGVLGTILGVAGVAAGVITGNPALVAGGVKVATSSIGSSKQQKGIDQAVTTYTQGAQQAGNILSSGYDEAKAAKLAALAEIGALTPEQMKATLDAIDAGQVQYVDTMIATGENYAGQMADGGAAYRSALTGAGALYSQDLGQAASQYSGRLTKLGDTYAQDLDKIAATYGAEINQLAVQLGVDIETAAQIFADGLSKSADRHASELLAAAEAEAEGLEGAADEYGVTRLKGLQAVTSALTPYAEGRGTPALDHLNSLMNADPSKLDPMQARMREKFLRDSSARLAASGLRGAGRAGVAAVNEGDAELMAQMYVENRDRAAGAASELARTGYGAAGQVGAAGERAYSNIGEVTMGAKNRGLSAISSARQRGSEYGAESRATGLQAVSSAKDRAAVARQRAGETAAQATRSAGEEGAATRLNLGKDAASTTRDYAKTAADTRLNLGKDAALNDQDTARKIAGVDLDIGTAVANQGLKAVDSRIGATDRAYDQARDVAGKEGDAIADAALGKAGAQAGAVADPAWIAAQAALAKGNIKSDTIGAIGSSVADLITGGMKKAS